jgi:hypothetical protein
LPLKTDPYWQPFIHELGSVRPKLTHQEIANRLASLAEKVGRDDPPSVATVRRKRPKHPVPLYKWPDTHERDELPWEASRTGWGVLGLYRGLGLSRPSVERVRWHWRLNQALGEPDYWPVRNENLIARASQEGWDWFEEAMAQDILSGSRVKVEEQ